MKKTRPAPRRVAPGRILRVRIIEKTLAYKTKLSVHLHCLGIQMSTVER